MIRLTILLAFVASRLGCQTCELERANPVTCLTLEYVRDLAIMARAEESGKAEARASDDTTVSAFYVIKTRMNAERLIRTQLAAYRASPDRKTADAARYAQQVFSIFLRWDSTAEANLRRIVAFKSSVGEMEELQAEQKVHADQSLELLIAGSGAVLDASILMQGRPPRAVGRRMTVANRDRIVAEIEKAFRGHLTVEPDSLWYSGWAATAASMRSNLLDAGWKYLP